MIFEEIVAQIREKLSGADISAIQENVAIQVNLTGRTAGTFYIEVRDGKLSVEPYEYIDRDAMLTLPAASFLKLAEGKLDPIEEATAGRLQFEGDAEKALKVIELGKQVQAGAPALKAAKNKAVKRAK